MSKLVLRCCRSDFTSRNGFVWPSEVGAVVVAPDWEPTEECGNGLHGWLYGHGDIACVTYWEEADSKWLVLEVDDVIELDGKCKFERAVVRFAGGKSDAAAFLLENEPQAESGKVIGLALSVGDEKSVVVGALGTATVGRGGTATVGYKGTATVGDYGTATVGYKGTATVGDYGTATVGYKGTANVGYKGTATVGDYGTATVGDDGTATVGYKGTATVGDDGTATVGDYGTATVGDGGTATVGDYGTATVGDYGTATVGDYGTATGGENAELCIRWFDYGAWRYRTEIAYVGENGIKPNVAYRLNDEHRFVEVV